MWERPQCRERRDRAVRAGAKVTKPLDDMFWGDRYGNLEDPFGHQWSIGTQVPDVSPEEMQKAMEQMGQPASLLPKWNF